MKKVEEFFFITIGIILISLGLEFFLFPNNIAAGGVSGLALVVQNILNIPAGIVMWVVNIILFVIQITKYT